VWVTWLMPGAAPDQARVATGADAGATTLRLDSDVADRGCGRALPGYARGPFQN
jgi:hypothetical protein